jgi:hypothetical protein
VQGERDDVSGRCAGTTENERRIDQHAPQRAMARHHCDSRRTGLGCLWHSGDAGTSDCGAHDSSASHDGDPIRVR